MPQRELFEKDSYYHIYNRGLRKQTLFHREQDFERFMIYVDSYIEKCKDDFIILAYCILPNHFHFVFHNTTDSYRISYFIGNICASYTRYYYNRYGVDKGRIYFESRFKCKLIDDKEYLQQCISYVENNPIKHGIVEKGEDWFFRSDTLASLATFSPSATCHPGDNEANHNLEADLE